MANDICLLELGAEVDTGSGLVDVTDIAPEEPELGTRCSAADWEGGDGNSLYKVYGKKIAKTRSKQANRDQPALCCSFLNHSLKFSLSWAFKTTPVIFCHCT